MSVLAGTYNFLRTLTAFLVAGAVWVISNSQGWLDPVPYRDAEVTSVVLRDDRHLIVTGGFTKTEETCLLERVTIYAVLPRSLTPLAFEPIREEGEGARRLAGEQTFQWDVFLNGWFPDFVEVWTRHDCEGEIVERLMVRFAVPPVTIGG